ncbi:MAG: hypothetical protein ABIO37_01240 [Caulobacteraceae bacterium]
MKTQTNSTLRLAAALIGVGSLALAGGAYAKDKMATDHMATATAGAMKSDHMATGAMKSDHMATDHMAAPAGKAKVKVKAPATGAMASSGAMAATPAKK